MIHLLLSILAIVFTIFFVVGTHEYAHFLAARFFKVKVIRFSIGFGKTLFRFRGKHGTEYVFSWIPLGGYVQMLDETEGKVSKADLSHAFNRQPFYKKFLIVAAGPCMNLLCAFLLYWLIFTVGFVTVKPITGPIAPRSIAAHAAITPQQEILSIDGHPVNGWMSIIFRLIAHAGNHDYAQVQTKNLSDKQLETHVLDLTDWHMNDLTPDPLGSLGIRPYIPDIPLVINTIAPDSPAAASPLKIGDKILSINGEDVKDWENVTNIILKYPDQTVSFKIERKGETLTLPVNIGYQRDLLFSKSGYLGIGPLFNWPKDLIRKVQYGPLEAIPHAATEMYNFIYFNLLLIGKLVTGKLSLQSLGGPITIFESAGEALNYGFLSFMSFLAFLSISIGIINFLPIPGLDGGHLFIYTIEMIIQRPVPEKVLLLLYRIGILLIFFFLIQAIINDVLRLY